MQSLSVTDITNLIKMNLEDAFYDVCVEGEISNSKLSSTGHWYFTLKDKTASISCIMFSRALSNLKTPLENGTKVLVNGSINVYALNGSYSLICKSISIGGQGSIAQMLEERKKDFLKKGYFNKKNLTLPKYPKSICVITSETGAALQDIIRTVKNRAPSVKLYLLSCVVQGDEAKHEVSKAIEFANKNNIGEIILISRGGGSLEDLLPFSEEIVVKAISQSNIPTISAIGHEIDTPLSDYAATISASTPTQGAEKATIGYETINRVLENNKKIIINNLNNRIYTLERDFDNINDKIITSINYKIATLKLKFNSFNAKSNSQLILKSINSQKELVNLLNKNNKDFILNKLNNLKNEKNNILNLINAHSPKTIFDKGFALIKNENGDLIQNINDVNLNDNLQLLVKNGIIKTNVVKKMEVDIWQA